MARPTCVVALDQCVRSACVATLTIRSFPYRNGTPFAPAVLKVLRSSKYSLLTSWARRSALAPFRLSMFFLFRGGDFLKLNGRKRGEEVFVLYNTIVLKNNSRYTKTVDMSNSAKKLGDNIRRIRLAKDMTQGDLCRKLGLDRAYMSNVESGKKNPTLSTITNIAKALDVSVDELLK